MQFPQSILNAGKLTNSVKALQTGGWLFSNVVLVTDTEKSPPPDLFVLICKKNYYAHLKKELRPLFKFASRCKNDLKAVRD